MRLIPPLLLISGGLLLLLGGGLAGTSPLDVDRLTVVVIRDVSGRQNLPPGQAIAIEQVEHLATEYAKATPPVAFQYRIVDPDDHVDFAPEWTREALARPRGELPWIIIANGRDGWEGPVPDSPAACKELIARYQLAP